MNEKLLYSLAEIIKQELEKEFEHYKLSGQMQDSISIKKTKDGVSVILDAQKYEISTFIRTGRIINKPGSYALELNEKGSPFKHHKNFVDKRINSAIDRWCKENNIRIKRG